MYENQISITQLMFLQRVMSEMLYFVSCLRVRKNVEEIQISFSSLRACLFYYGDIPNLRNGILNIDQLEMKHTLVSGVSIVKLAVTIRNPRLCFTFGFTTRCLQNASKESYKHSSHPGTFAFLQDGTVLP